MRQNLFSLFSFTHTLYIHTVYFNSFIGLCIVKIFNADYILFLKQMQVIWSTIHRSNSIQNWQFFIQSRNSVQILVDEICTYIVCNIIYNINTVQYSLPVQEVTLPITEFGVQISWTILTWAWYQYIIF